ncbi:MAG: ROK family protein [Sulfuricellaceae bacterium]|nr:ROK family protein [Sulfuricellaceae bacterium]
MPEHIVATFDLGGTNMRAATMAISNTSWRMLDQLRRPTQSYLSVPAASAARQLDALLDFITDYADTARSRFGAVAIAAAFPGPVQGHGVVLALPTMWGPDGQSLCPMDLAGQLRTRLPEMEVKVMNDVSAAGYRFVQEGGDFALFTLGSGIGLKVFLDGQPRVGPHGFGGELTHMVFDARPDAPLCDCGGRGHLGALASGRAWQHAVAAAQERGQEPDLHRFVEPLARAVAMLHFSLGLERFIFAGGLAEGLGETLREAIVQNLPNQGWNLCQDWNAMVQLAPADDAHALIGGALASASASRLFQ